MSNTQHIPIDDLYLFALQFLPEVEAKFYTEHLAGCADCRRQLGWIQGDLAGYAMSVELVDPPAGAKEALVRRVAQERKDVPAMHGVASLGTAVPVQAVDYASGNVPGNVRVGGSVHGSASGAIMREPVESLQTATVYEMKPRRTAAVMAWAGWAVAAGLAVTAGLEFQDRQKLRGAYNEATTKLSEMSSQYAMAQTVLEALSNTGAKRVALRVPPSGSAKPVPPLPEAHASYLKEKGSLVFVASNLDPIRPDATYELWLLPAEKGAAPIPAGTFKPDARGNAGFTASNLAKGTEVAGFGVTVEPDGGSKSPTMPIVLVGL